MLAAGCLFPFLLLVGGALLGVKIGGEQASIIGGAVGFVIGIAIPAIGFWILRRATRDEKERP